MLPIPATFIVSRDGLVKVRYIDPDYRRRMELDASSPRWVVCMQRALEFQFNRLRLQKQKAK
jgi:hypothetical protein